MGHRQTLRLLLEHSISNGVATTCMCECMHDQIYCGRMPGLRI
jgi:hypothetical protein